MARSSLVLGYGSLRFDHAGLAAGDLTPRADGNRRYTLYAERVATAAP